MLDGVLTNFQKITKKKEYFLSAQENASKDSKATLKNLYDFLKTEEALKIKSRALPQLVVEGFDEEQIWQEIELQNEGIYDHLVKSVSILLAKKDRLRFETEEPNDDESGDESVSELNFGSDEGNSDDDEEVDNNDESISDEQEEEEEEDDETGPNFTSEVDDEFFKLSEMENFCDKVEKDEELGFGKMKIPFDFFSEEPEDDGEDVELIRFNDFFKAQTVSKRKQKDQRNREGTSQKKRVMFAEEEFDEEINDEEPSAESTDNLLRNDKSDSEDEGPKSSFDARQERLRARIDALENDALKEKAWYLKGEVTSGSRPQNSLLEEYVEFDIGARPAPVFTEKTTLRLEDIIKQRMKDKVWDDVTRKVKPVEDIREYRKQLVLDQEKSKLSLAEIYEQEFIKKRDAATADPAEEKEDVEPEKHIEIKKLIKSLFTKLDALSNFHYTPKSVEPEIKIITNMPAINMEEVAPVGTSDGALLAPEEIKHKPKGELMSKSEKTTSDKKRERRQKKVKQRMRQKEKEKKEKLLNKLPLGLGNKYSKEKASKALDKLTKERNVDKMVETQSKHLNSSSAFFSKLQDEVKSQVKRKAGSIGTKNKKMEKFSAKKIKL